MTKRFPKADETPTWSDRLGHFLDDMRDHRFVILTTLLAVAVGIMCYTLVGMRVNQDKIESQQVKLANNDKQLRALSAQNHRLIIDNKVNITELQRQKASIASLRRTNCGIRKALLQGAVRAEKAGRQAEARQTRAFLKIFPAENCTILDGTGRGLPQ